MPRTIPHFPVPAQAWKWTHALADESLEPLIACLFSTTCCTPDCNTMPYTRVGCRPFIGVYLQRLIRPHELCSCSAITFSAPYVFGVFLYLIISCNESTLLPLMRQFAPKRNHWIHCGGSSLCHGVMNAQHDCSLTNAGRVTHQLEQKDHNMRKVGSSGSQVLDLMCIWRSFVHFRTLLTLCRQTDLNNLQSSTKKRSAATSGLYDDQDECEGAVYFNTLI